MKTLDDIRAAYPHLGLALYAYVPGGPFVLECLSADGKTFKFTGATEAEAVAAAFPDEDTPESGHPAQDPRRAAETSPAAASPGAPTLTNVFE